MNPMIWLVLWLAAAVMLLILGAIGGYPVGYRRGYAEAARHDRHTHRQGDPPPLPVAGRLEPVPEDYPPPDSPLWDWQFFGGAQVEPQPGREEYELLVSTVSPSEGETAALPASVTGEPPIDTGEIMAITDRVEGWIAAWNAQSNFDQHTIMGKVE